MSLIRSPRPLVLQRRDDYTLYSFANDLKFKKWTKVDRKRTISVPRGSF